MKQCGFTYQELATLTGNLKSLDQGDQIELTRIIDENNKSIKAYIDEKTSPENVTSDVSSQIMNDLRKRGIKF